MFRLILLVSTLLGVSLGDSLMTKIRISEHGAEYEETVEYDPATKAVTYHVPKHNNILESTVIIHTPSDSMISFDPVGKTCRLSSSPDGYNPELSVMKTFSLSANNITVTPEDAQTSFQLNYFKGVISEERRAGLLEAMQTLCKDVDIEEIEKITVSEEELNRHSVGPIHRSNSTRLKRSNGAFLDSLITCNTIEDRCTDMNAGNYCVWYWNVDRSDASNSNIQHVRDSNWRCLTCCEEKTAGKMCKCNTIDSPSSFATCQANMFDVPQRLGESVGVGVDPITACGVSLGVCIIGCTVGNVIDDEALLAPCIEACCVAAAEYAATCAICAAIG